MSNPAIKSDLPANNSPIIPIYVPLTLTDHVPSGDKWYEELYNETKHIHRMQIFANFWLTLNPE